MQCFHRWTKVFNGGTKGPWSPEDDARVAELVGQIGAKKWSCIAAQLPGRTGKQCRERWHNHLNPHISKVPWSEHEVRVGQEIPYICATHERCTCVAPPGCCPLPDC